MNDRDYSIRQITGFVLAVALFAAIVTMLTDGLMNVARVRADAEKTTLSFHVSQQRPPFSSK